ncbi:hypothetical protein ACWEWG_22230 [Streptomyces sp. NPDC003758]|uniref:Secreted protein n=1 Tax=Streptomyces cynarae TaxID=2981134 RepID=A0ABY6E7M0_9ACTN|nr:hypothetical protein [Streptomyces cynarae]UXY22659.1 hypothetical protein N8I84_31085 [Streptomyces cynarae]
MATRSTVVTAAIAAAAALAATGITYANAASEPVQAAPAAPVAAAPAPAAAPALPQGGNGDNNNSKGNEGREEHGDHDRGEDEDRDRGYHHEYFGKVRINEREYPAIPDGCVTIVSGLGSKSLNIRNDSRKTVEVFSGATCDNGAPIAVVGPWSQSDGVHPRHVRGGVKVKHGVVGSFRVIRHHHEDHEKGDRGDRD